MANSMRMGRCPFGFFLSPMAPRPCPAASPRARMEARFKLFGRAARVLLAAVGGGFRVVDFCFEWVCVVFLSDPQNQKGWFSLWSPLNRKQMRVPSPYQLSKSSHVQIPDLSPSLWKRDSAPNQTTGLQATLLELEVDESSWKESRVSDTREQDRASICVRLYFSFWVI